MGRVIYIMCQVLCRVRIHTAAYELGKTWTRGGGGLWVKGVADVSFELRFLTVTVVPPTRHVPRGISGGKIREEMAQ